MHSLLDGIESMLTQDAADRGLQFLLKKEFEDDVLVGDGIRLRQVILNLLSNSLKFTPSGGTVLLSITEDRSTPDDAVFTFRVSDTGIGIAEEEQQRVFKSFEQLGSNYSKSQGTGLGLAISKSIVHLMGGELKLSSRSGEGSEFYFTVTFPKGQLDEGEGKELKEEENLLHGVNILVVEDNELNAEIAIELLNLQGPLL